MKNEYSYIDTQGKEQKVVASTPEEALSNAQNIAPRSGVQKITPITSPAPAPTGTVVPELPTPKAPQIQEAYVGSLSENLAKTKESLSSLYKERKAEVDRKLEEAQIIQQGFMSKMDPTTRPTYDEEMRTIQNQADAAESASKSITKNFEDNQKLVDELDGLLTEGNTLIELSRLSSPTSKIAQQANVNNTIQKVAARAGIIESVMSARNGQISQAYNIINQSRNAIEANWQDTKDYYGALIDYNEKGIISLDKESKEIAEKEMAMAEADYKKLDKTTEYIKELMINPDKAQFMASAGVTLLDSVEEINRKMSEQSKREEVNDLRNELMLKGYIPLGYNAPGAVSFDVGGQKLYFKAPAGKGTGKALSILDVNRYQETYPNAGVLPGDTEEEANAKVQALSTPEGQIKGLILSAKNAGNSYEDVISAIDEDPEITDKETAKQIAAEEYGVSEENTTVESSPLEDEIAQLKETGRLTNSDVRELLRNRGYSREEIANSSVGGIISQIESFLFR